MNALWCWQNAPWKLLRRWDLKQNYVFSLFFNWQVYGNEDLEAFCSKFAHWMLLTGNHKNLRTSSPFKLRPSNPPPPPSARQYRTVLLSKSTLTMIYSLARPYRVSETIEIVRIRFQLHQCCTYTTNGTNLVAWLGKACDGKAALCWGSWRSIQEYL